jgi:hypothetical protein
MRALDDIEVHAVVGAGEEILDEVVITGRRIKDGVIVITDRMAIMNLLEQMDQDRSGSGGGEAIFEVVVEAARDHCGNKDFNVPDIVRESCKQHDKDYSKDSELSRKEADDRFLENMKKELAEKNPDMPKAVRDAIANVYYNAVRENGHDSYKGKGTNDRVVREGDGIPRVPRF